MKVIIAGPRDLSVTHKEIGRAILNSGFDVTEIISGGASGIDSCAIAFAQNNKVPFSVCYANWQEYGRQAGPVRNREMAKQADALIIVKRKGTWTRGTRNMHQTALEFALPTHVEDKEI